MMFMISVDTRALQSWQASPKEGPVCLLRSIDDELIYLRCVALGARPRPKAISLSISDRVIINVKIFIETHTLRGEDMQGGAEPHWSGGNSVNAPYPSLLKEHATGLYIEEIYTVQYDICILQEFGYIILAYTLVKNFYIGLWIYSQGHLLHSFGLMHADGFYGSSHLPVEIGYFKMIKISDIEALEACAGQREKVVAAHAANPGYGYSCLPDFLLLCRRDESQVSAKGLVI